MPLKFLEVWLLAHKYLAARQLVFVFAKLVGLGVTAFIFEVTSHKLLQMAWFRWLYEYVLVWLAWAHGLTDPIKRTAFEGCCACSRAGRGGRTLRLLLAHPPPPHATPARAQSARRFAVNAECSSVRREQPNRHEGEPEQAEPAGEIAQHHHAGDDRRRASTMPIWNAAEANS